MARRGRDRTIEYCISSIRISIIEPIATWLDWADVPVVLAVARTGSLSAAAAVLGITQPTVSRRIAACEARIGARLFARTSRGVAVTAAGARLIERAERANRELVAAESAVAGPDSAIAGEIRLTASEWLCDRVLARAAARLIAVHPRISIELIAGARWLNLPEREADVAIRPVRYKHHSVTQSRLAAVSYALYASPAYLAERGEPDWSRRLVGQRIAVMTQSPGQSIADVKWLARVGSGAAIAGRCNGRDALAEMAAAGAGIVCLPRLVGDATAGLRRLGGPAPPRRTLWLGVSRACRGLPRVRALIDHMRATFAELEDRLAPPA